MHRDFKEILDDKETLELAAGLHSGATQDTQELLARLVWSYLIEPGDRIAGAVINCFGALKALLQLVMADGAKSYAAAVISAYNTTLPGLSHGAELPDLMVGTNLDVSPRELCHAYKRWSLRLNETDVKTALRLGVSHGMRFIVPNDPLWPAQLAGLGLHAPVLLWGYGDLGILQKSGIAVVGSRAMSGYGKRVTCDFSAIIAEQNVSIISGGAYGVDAAAHRTALAVGAKTIAVMAGGLDKAYPVAHTDMLQEIAQCGVVCSEMMPGAAPTRWRFLQRNRVLAALAAGVLVTEASARSGSMNTARHALEMERPIAAVPGSVVTADAVGCHKLIADCGAKLIANGEDVKLFTSESLEGLMFHGLLDTDFALADTDDSADCASVSEYKTTSNSPAVRVEDALPRRGSSDIARIAATAGMEVGETQMILNELELLGKAVRVEKEYATGWKRATPG